MQHISPHFSGSSLEEWLFYFIPSIFGGFQILMRAEDGSVISGKGKITSTRSIDLSFFIEGLGKRVEFEARPDPAFPWRIRVLNAAPMDGVWKLDHVEAGSARLVPFSDDMFFLSSKELGIKVNARKSISRLAVCPLIVEGINGCEMILEEYPLMDRKRQKALPAEPPRKHFFGSCRFVRYVAESGRTPIEVLAIIIAVAGWRLFPDYMPNDSCS